MENLPIEAPWHVMKISPDRYYHLVDGHTSNKEAQNIIDAIQKEFAMQERMQEIKDKVYRSITI